MGTILGRLSQYLRPTYLIFDVDYKKMTYGKSSLVFVGMTFLMAACSSSLDSKTDDSRVNAHIEQNLADDQIVKAILFNIGPGAGRLDKLTQISNALENEKAAENLLQILRKKDPQFITKFAQAMRSKDPYAIHYKLLETSSLVLEKIPLKSGNECGVAVVCVAAAVVHNMAAVTSVAVGATVAAAAATVVVYLANWVTSASSQYANLEELSAEIAAKY